jgi:hypothetical protein
MADELGLRAAERTALVSTTLAAIAAGFAGRATRAGNSLMSRGQRNQRSLVASVVRASHEPKNLDLSIALTNLNATSISIMLNPINQGSAATNRTGRVVVHDRLRISGVFNCPTTNPGDIVRLTLVYDKESRGAACAFTDFLSTTASQVQAMNANFTLDSTPIRFKILADKRYEIKPSYSAQTFQQPYQLEVPLKGLRTHYYNSTGNGISDVDSGSLYLFYIALGAADFVQYSLDSHLIFRDI